MKVIIAGSRSIEDYSLICKAIRMSRFEITEVVSGHARGVDLIGERWANSNSIPIKEFPVSSHDWDTFGKSAGYRRNVKMAEYADAVIVVWDGSSRGSKHMIDIAKRMRMPCYVYVCNDGALW